MFEEFLKHPLSVLTEQVWNNQTKSSLRLLPPRLSLIYFLSSFRTFPFILLILANLKYRLYPDHIFLPLCVCSFILLLHLGFKVIIFLKACHMLSIMQSTYIYLFSHSLPLPYTLPIFIYL